MLRQESNAFRLGQDVVQVVGDALFLETELIANRISFRVERKHGAARHRMDGDIFHEMRQVVCDKVGNMHELPETDDLCRRRRIHPPFEQDFGVMSGEFVRETRFFVP